MRRLAAGLALMTLLLIASAGQARHGETVEPSLDLVAAHAKSLGLGDATVAVAVATVWHQPSSARAVDAPALANPVKIRQWLKAMSLSQRRALSGRADTEALLGERVKVLALSGAWARVVVPDQPTPLDSRGYPGWIPKRQLINGVVSSATTVTVVKATTWLRTTGSARLLEVSIGTRLAGIGRSGSNWKVRLPDGRVATVATSSVVTHPLAATGRSMVATAKRFLGLDYLWAGTSGFGFDCSGLMQVVYRVHGITIPRDSAVQATAGHAVRRSALKPGDLVFFATGGKVHHVGMYVGNGLMLHAPHTGSHVQITRLSAAPWAKEYAGARRFLT